ncbi:MAG: MOP flippase family protein [Chlorobiales bacterium]|nr:MOP flippase family protein [Chlorobiales bacterium]
MSLKKAAASGVKWTAVSSVGTAGLQFLQLAVLSRLLQPEDFGLLSMLMVVIGFARIYNDMGISNAIVYHQEITPQQLSSLYWLNMAMGIFIYLVVIAVSPLIIHFYHEPRLETLIPWGALVFVISPIGQQFQALFQKELNFQVLSVIEVVSAIIGVAVSIVLAYNNQGVLSVIWGQLCDTTVRSLLFYLKGSKTWRPGFHFKRADLEGFLGFGFYQMGDRTITYFNSNVDQLLIGSLLGAQSLGFYTLATNLIFQPIARINPILTRVAFPVFAKMQSENDRIRNAYYTLLRLLSFINFPLLLGIIAVAPSFVPIIFGEKWLPSVPLIQLLGIAAVLRAVQNPIGSLLLAKGRADIGFKWSLFATLSTVIGVFAGIKSGALIGISVSLILLSVFYFVLSYRVLIKPLIEGRFKGYLFSMMPNLLISLVMAAIIGVLLPMFITTTLWLLITQIITGILIYIGLNFLFQPKQIDEIKSLVFGRS